MKLTRAQLDKMKDLLHISDERRVGPHNTPGPNLYEAMREMALASLDIPDHHGMIKALANQKEELLEALTDMVHQHCSDPNPQNGIDVDSWALSANASAIRLLAKHGKLRIEKEYGRRVLAIWSEDVPHE